MWQSPLSGFCNTEYDARLTPTGRPNEWNVEFIWNQDLIWGKAVLANGQLLITASYATSQAFSDFEVKLTFSPDFKRVDYQRRINPFAGPGFLATGRLFH